jgi:hypothetical protein
MALVVLARNAPCVFVLVQLVFVIDTLVLVKVVILYARRRRK